MARSKQKTENSLFEEIKEKGGLYNYLTNTLNFYYKKEKINQVENFLNWVKENEKNLITELKLPENMQFNLALFFVGTYLGGIYMADRYNIPRNKLPKLMMEKSSFFKNLFAPIHYDPIEHAIWISPSKVKDITSDLETPDIFICGFNIGIHEYTHGLYQSKKGEKRSLSEVATAYNQSEYGLPLKVNSLNKKTWSNTNRDFIQIYEEIERENIDEKTVKAYFYEYFSFLVMPWLKNYYGEKFNIMDFRNESPDIMEPITDEIYLLGGSKILLGIPRFVKKEIFVSEDLFVQNYYLFCKSAGINNPELVDKFRIVFDKIRKTKWDSKIEFYNKFIDIMNEVFGIPKDNNIPEGYVSTETQQNLPALEIYGDKKIKLA
ncbi:hypothetical protein KO465_09515 [Candidatus Micrarchaeota archaeon]|jgi:hypothetical protein|nr:hypothetical protein [Candidatus Micrarchaeota archaeon]